MMRGWREQDRWSGRRARGGSGTEGEDWLIGMWRIKGEAEKILWAEMRKGWKGGQLGGFKKDNWVKEVERRGSEGLHWGKVSGAIWNGERRMRSNLEAERMTKWWSGKENGGGGRTRKSSQQRWCGLEKERRAEMPSWFPADGSGPQHQHLHTLLHTHSPRSLPHTHHTGGREKLKWSCFYPEEPILSSTEHQFTHNRPQGRHIRLCLCARLCVRACAHIPFFLRRKTLPQNVWVVFFQFLTSDF